MSVEKSVLMPPSDEAAAAYQAGLLAGAKAMQAKCVSAMENLCFFTDIDEQLAMTKQDMSDRTCHEGAAAIRALDPEQIAPPGEQLA